MMRKTVYRVGREVFEVRERDGGYDYRWIEGRHHGDYGFHSKPSQGSAIPTPEDHEAAIRSFLEAVEPTTGHLE